jgi:hypothetical protein
MLFSRMIYLCVKYFSAYFFAFYMQCTKKSYDTKQIKKYSTFFPRICRSPPLFVRGVYFVIFRRNKLIWLHCEYHRAYIIILWRN